MSAERAQRPAPGEMPEAERRLYDAPTASMQRRREHAVRARRRRLLAADLAAGAALALFGLIAAPGLAVLVIAALLALLACGAWLLVEKLRARRALAPRRGRRRDRWRSRRGPRGPRGPSAGPARPGGAR